MKKFVISIFLFAFPLCGEEAEKKEPHKEETSVTEHRIVIHGKPVEYKAVAGTFVLKDGEEKDKAHLFYIAYTKEGEKDRPITFCFNGGPGSSSVWLHVGVFGPKRVSLKKPYRLIDNPYSLLEVTDLVFIDPVSTGHSRPAKEEDPKQFHGVEEDIQWVAEFIRLYTTRNNRWGSPKFLAGESYGTTRAAGLAKYLHDQVNMEIEGVIFVSSVLNFQTISNSNRGNDLPYMLYLPSYTATAWYHKKLSPEMQRQPLEDVLQKAEEFAIGEYAHLLLKGDQMSPNERKDLVAKLSRYTGLSQTFVDNTDCRIGNLRFAKELLRDERRIIGRFDSRYRGIDHDAAGEWPESDPSFDAVCGAFAASFKDYLFRDLNWKKDREYKILTSDVRPWNYGKTKNEYLNTAEALRNVMARNRDLRVFVASGRYDLATPYFASDYTMNHLGLDPVHRGHIVQTYYPAGHMMYTDEGSLVQLSKDLSAFIRAKSP